MSLDVAVLTDSRLLPPDDRDWYRRQVHHEDGLVLTALQRQGLLVRRLAWDDPDMDWADARCALFRTTWDYFERLPAFADWLARAAGHSPRQNCRLARLPSASAIRAWSSQRPAIASVASLWTLA